MFGSFGSFGNSGVNQDIVEELLRLYSRTARDMATGLRVRYRDTYNPLEVSILADAFIAAYMRRFWNHPTSVPTILEFQKRCLDSHVKLAGPRATPEEINAFAEARRKSYYNALASDFAQLIQASKTGSGTSTLGEFSQEAARRVFSDSSPEMATVLFAWLHPLMRACTWLLRKLPHVPVPRGMAR